jgi:histone H3/H4
MASSDLSLPRALIKRAVVGKADGFNVGKESLSAFSETAKVFVSLLGSTATDIARESKRQTINAEDVVKALDELEFVEIVPELREFLTGDRSFERHAVHARRPPSLGHVCLHAAGACLHRGWMCHHGGTASVPGAS